MQHPHHPKSTTRIFLNPKFPRVHINPNFLVSNPPINKEAAAQSKIYINPKFLAANQPVKAPPVPVTSTPLVVTRRKLIRASSLKTEPQTQKPIDPSRVPTNRLLALSRNKLVRYQPQRPKIIPIQKMISRPTKSKYKLKNLLQSTFKIDRRSIKSLSPKNLTKRKPPIFESKHKKLVRVNINGVPYHSTRTKLQRSTSRTSSERLVIVRGEKFQLDANGTQLQKLDGVGPRKRIDIGGVTFVKNIKTNTFVRTDTHLARNHLNSTKQRSISVLSKNLVKNNQPCAIYRRLGKCIALARGRCPKVHDPKQVSICQRFLKGQCSNTNCLLSHKVSLSKMPTCKFFLKGVCVNSDCPYLHKKVNQSTAICEQFLKGYCSLAEQCPKRHEFECPDFETKRNCVEPHKHTKETEKTKPNSTETDESSTQLRYYLDNNDGAIGERRERMLANVEKLKANFTGVVDEVVVTKTDNLLKNRHKAGSTPAFIPI